VIDAETVKVARVLSPADATELVGFPVAALTPTVTRATWAVDADSGQPVLGYWPLGDVGDLRRAVREVEIRETYRAASGRRNASRVFGWVPRRPVQRREACNSTSFAKEQPAKQAVLDAWAVKLLGQLRELDPAVADHDEATMREVLPEWPEPPGPPASSTRTANCPTTGTASTSPPGRRCPCCAAGWTAGTCTSPSTT
jgi:hypothetical protein